MARTIPIVHPQPDPDLSFVPGTGKLDHGSGGVTPPHGPRDIGLALNHTYANGAACVVIGQLWRKGETIHNSTAGFPADPDLIYQVPADSAFTSFHLAVYYLANTVHAEGIKVRIAELAVETTLATEDAAEAQRVAESDWSPAGVAAYAGEVLTFEVYIKGDATGYNSLCGFYVERNPVSGTVPEGSHYDPPFIGIDQTAVDWDSPLSSDVLHCMRADFVALKAKRKRMILQWSRQTGTLTADYGGFFATLIPVLVTGAVNTNTGTVRALGTDTNSVNLCAGRAGIRLGPYTVGTALEAGTWKSGACAIEGNGILPIEGPYAQVIAQVGTIDPPPPDASLNPLRSLSVWGS